MKLNISGWLTLLSRQKFEFLLTLIAALAGISVIAWAATFLLGWPLVGVLLLTGLVTAVIIQFTRIRTYQRLNLLRHQVRISAAIGQEITANVEMQTLLIETAQLLADEFQYDYVGIFLLDDKEHVTAMAEVGQGSHQQIKMAKSVVDYGALAAVVVQQQAINQNGTVTADAILRESLLEGMKSELALPLIVGQKLLGILDIQSQEGILFDEDYVLALQSLAAQTAVAIRNAALYQREMSRRRMAETFYDIGLALNDTLDRQRVLDLILEQLVAIVPYDRGSLLLHRGSDLEIVAARGFPAESNPLQIRVPLNEDDSNDIYKQIQQSQQPLVVPDLKEQLNWVHVEGLPIAYSWLGVPLIHENDVIGMLSLVRETADNPYKLDDTLPSTTFAVQAATALHNAELYNRIEVYNRQLAYEVEQRTTAVLQLARLDQAKSDFINVAAHELRTPLTTIKGYCQMLLHQPVFAEDKTSQELMNGIFQGANRLHDIVNNLLNVAKIDSQSLDLHFQLVHTATMIERICARFQSDLLVRDLTLTLQDTAALPDIQGDLESLKMVFLQLLLNAMKYTPDGGKIAVTYHVLSDDDREFPGHIEFIVSDTGIGIAPDVQGLIFDKLYRVGEISLHSSGKTKFKGGGPGLGLAIVRGIVEAHNGKVWVDSRDHDEDLLPGSQFHVLLPVQQ
ncbi:MAG: GAF domain-containing protein [Chloroflexi bacterium]|nr:GAF domain-containing protein [Chloroflexota bacterium]